MKYLCLAYEEENTLNALSRQQWDELRRETLAYVDALRESGHLIATQALQSARTATMVRVRGGKRATTDGPFAETKEQIGGFFPDRGPGLQRGHRDRVQVAFGAHRQHRGAADRGGSARGAPLPMITSRLKRACRLPAPRFD